MRGCVDLVVAAAAREAHWSARVGACTNGQLVEVAKLLAEFAWHDHAREDEVFRVLAGELAIHFEDRPAVRLGPGQMDVVPADVRHNPGAERETLIAPIEPEATAHTGEVVTARTRSLAERMAGAGA